MSRLDVFLVENGYYSSRARAQRAISEGCVKINDKVILKASFDVSDSDEIFAGEDPIPYVSRGAFKLKHAFEIYPLDIQGKICLDVGASTGGFTEILLNKGARKVVAVDVGHGQLDESLVSNNKVVNLEGTDIRNLDKSLYTSCFDFAGIDVSFISLTYILNDVYSYLKNNSFCVALIKPQFEMGKKALTKKGIIKDAKYLKEATDKIINFAVACGFDFITVSESPVKGGDGNTEFLLILKKH